MIKCIYKASDYTEKILLVEDDISIHSLIKELLLKENYTIIDAYSGTEALILLEKENVNLIILDLMILGINGEEIIKKYNYIPIIVLSAKTNVEDKVNNLLNGPMTISQNHLIMMN